MLNVGSQLIASICICCVNPDLQDWQQETDPRPQYLQCSCWPLGHRVTYGTMCRDPVFYETFWPDSAVVAINTIYVPCLLGSAMTLAICLLHQGGGSWPVEALGVESYTGLHSVILAQPWM